MDDIYKILKDALWSILPLAIIILSIQIFVLSMPFEIVLQFLVGTIMVLIGFFLFLSGVELGLLPVGEMIGNKIPFLKRISLILLYGLILGYAVTISEPAVRVLGQQAASVTEGEISQALLVQVVAVGVAISVAIAFMLLILKLPLKYLLLTGYTIIIALFYFVPADFAPISFDAGGATTGPMTVPFILAMGVGLASVMGDRTKNTTEGFGLVALASIGPVIAVMILGVVFG